ncbi:MAG: hypothetical protein HYU36_06495 [Planctomycetes bacterium]|nr:hypothetical protein [Planctomycetota bacterium]
MRSVCCLVLVGLLGAPSAQAAKYVKMYTDDTYTAQVKRPKLDCKLYRDKVSSLVVGFKLNIPFILSVGPEIGFKRETEMKWNDTQQELIRRYEKLCEYHNKGLLTVAEYNRRDKDLDEFYEKAVKLKEEIHKLIEERAEKAFADMEKESEKAKAAEAIAQEVKSLSDKVEVIAKEASELKEVATVPKEKMPFWKR